MLQGSNPYERVCPAGTIITGVTIRSGGWIDAIGPFDCGSSIAALSAIGGTGGGAFNREASANGYVAARLSSGGYINSITLTRANGTVSPQYGGSQYGSTSTVLACHSGMRIAGFFGNATSVYPVTLGVVCRAISKRVRGGASLAKALPRLHWACWFCLAPNASFCRLSCSAV